MTICRGAHGRCARSVGKQRKLAEEVIGAEVSDVLTVDRHLQLARFDKIKSVCIFALVDHDLSGNDIDGLDLRRDAFTQGVGQGREQLDAVEGRDPFARGRDLGVNSQHSPGKQHRAHQNDRAENEKALSH